MTYTGRYIYRVEGFEGSFDSRQAENKLKILTPYFYFKDNESFRGKDEAIFILHIFE